jgi:hypothetical protein
MEKLHQRVRDIKRRSAVLVEALGVQPTRAGEDQPEKHRAQGHAMMQFSLEGGRSGGQSLGTLAIKEFRFLNEEV